MITRHFLIYLIVIAIFLVGVAMPVNTIAQTVKPSITQEYFIQQAADEDLLITINGFEAEFESMISGQNGEIILRSGIPGSRIVPLFQYVDTSDNNRQLDIRVTSALNTDRSQFGLELTRLKIWDERSKAVSRAYRLLSFGMVSGRDDSAASWTVKIDSLVNASRLFRQFGMKEMRLWADYLAAHLVHHRLHDYSIVYSMTRDILSDLKVTRFEKIELATLQLQSAALIGLKRTGSLNVSADQADPVQVSLSRTATLAAALGFGFEQALALNVSGAEYAADAFYQQALEQFQLAVRIADSVGDNEFATGIRESMVDIHAILGDTQASSEVLQKIETQLLEEGAGDELALNLLAQGRLLIRKYRYKQAIDVLYQALEHENDSATRRQINFDLARIFYASGRLDETMSYLQLAGIKVDPGQAKRTNPFVDVAEGLRIMANTHRIRGEYAQMTKVRRAQGTIASDSAHYLYEKGLDEAAENASNRRLAQSAFRESHAAAVKIGNFDLQHLSRLQFCALGGAADGFCSTSNIKASFEWLINGGVPRFSLEAMFLWSKILVLNGRQSEAIGVLDRSVDEIHLLRFSLPGVLGAWYRERHDQLFEYYLELLASGPDQKAGNNGLASLLVLSKIRFIEKHASADADPETMSADTDPLRSQLAQREVPPSEPGLSALNKSINRGLASYRETFKKKFEDLSKTGLQKYLRSLANNEVVLTYHISPTTAQVWVGQKGRVERRNISRPAYIFSALQEARQGLANIGISSFDSKMDELGKRLLSPVSDLLSETIFWIPAGPLLGFPLDALRVNGRYLVEKHSLINLMSFPSNSHPARSLKTSTRNSMFLAGHPRDYTGDYATRLETSAEIQAVADLFIGPELRIVQGTALLPDEFQSEDFHSAKLVHLSMPGSIDLQYPDQSSFSLSGYVDAPGRAVLKPLDIQTQKLVADLVFLSATRVTEEVSSGFSSQPGLVSDFMDAGAKSVIARYWVDEGEIDEAFVTGFYRQLENTGNIATSLLSAKRQYIRNQRGRGLYDWAGYQLYID